MEFLHGQDPKRTLPGRGTVDYASPEHLIHLPERSVCCANFL
jgi:hypothetical protein